MHWRKLGFAFAPEPDSWMHSYAQTPTPLALPDRLRVFIGCRPEIPGDDLPVSRIGFVDLDRDDPTQVIGVSDGPVLALGDVGCFDEFGQHPCSIVRRGDEVWLYTVGWTRLVSVPFNRAIGLVVSHDWGRTFDRPFGRGPVVGASLEEPYLQQGPSVHRFGDIWHMWYLTGIDWVRHHGRMEAIYQIAHATSVDGIAWQRDGKPILPEALEHECQAGQTVIERDGVYHMWFSFRPGLDFREAGHGYRMGYAWSADLVEWVRDDTQAGLELSRDGWDSEMLCYPTVIEDQGRTLMFYCGNHFGRDGFGVAELIAG